MPLIFRTRASFRGSVHASAHGGLTMNLSEWSERLGIAASILTKKPSGGASGFSRSRARALLNTIYISTSV